VADARTYWTTDDEIRFIAGLGTGKWSTSYRVTQAGREQLLKRYKLAALDRVKWGGIDKGKVLEALDTELMSYS
jgi:hypothetical protein